MRVSDFAKELNISKQAVYQRIKARGLTLDTLVEDRKTGTLTAEGEVILRNVFDKSMVKKQSSKIDTLNGTVNDKEKVIVSLQSTIDKLTMEVSMLKDQVASLQKDKEDLQRMQRVMYINSLPWYKRRKAEKQLLLLEDNSIKTDV